MKPNDLAILLGLGRSTVTAWTNHEYREYFSPSAQGGQGRPRNFTDPDIRLMYALKVMKDNNTPPDTIHETLQRWRANDWQELPDMPDAPANFASVPVMPVAAADAALSTERRSLLREIAFLQERLAQLEAEHIARDTKRDAEQQAERAARDVLLREIGDLRADLAHTKTLLDLYESGRLKPKE